VCAALPACVKQILGRADSGFYCREAVEAYEEFHVQFVIIAIRRTHESRSHSECLDRDDDDGAGSAHQGRLNAYLDQMEA
ncbi:MAG: hypothetical protein LAQ69_47475, partial [Acidobacteriia bacterium]|nr:hypothetical protein [Terriglobia bacterium]